jgi:hypothetical protein
VFGGRGAATVLSKATTVFGAAFMVTSLTLTLIGAVRTTSTTRSIVAEEAQQAPLGAPMGTQAPGAVPPGADGAAPAGPAPVGPAPPGSAPAPQGSAPSTDAGSSAGDAGSGTAEESAGP